MLSCYSAAASAGAAGDADGNDDDDDDVGGAFNDEDEKEGNGDGDVVDVATDLIGIKSKSAVNHRFLDFSANRTQEIVYHRI